MFQNTADPSQFSEEVEELPWMPRPDGSWMKHADAWAPVDGVLGVRRKRKLELHHEDSPDCWCRPTLQDVGKYVLVIHNYKELPDA